MMPITNIKQHSPPPSIEDLFISATVKSLLERRVSTSRLKNLIYRIRNTSDELSMQEYDRIFELSYFLNKTLAFQESKKWDDKQLLIDHALDLAGGKLSLSARKDIRNQHYGREDLLFPGEIITNKKVQHYRDLKHLRAKVKTIENKITRYKLQQHTLRNSEDAYRQNLARHKQLGVKLNATIAEINQRYAKIDNSSYIHHKKKLRLLSELSSTTTDLHYALAKMKR